VISSGFSPVLQKGTLNTNFFFHNIHLKLELIGIKKSPAKIALKQIESAFFVLRIE